MDQTAFTGVGLMCGTSRDALDISICDYFKIKGKWTFELKYSVEVELPKNLRYKIENAEHNSAFELVELNNLVGRFFGRSTKNAIDDSKLNPSFVSSHGITIFHQPNKNLTFQIGNGAEIAAITGLKTICDFRSTDIAYTGQGAPLVPFADSLLFSDFEYTLNLGGFANLSKLQSPFTGYDLSVCNLALNHVVSELGVKFDNRGEIAKTGHINQSLLDQLNGLSYYRKTPPKSLGKEWFDLEFRPILDNYKSINVPDRLQTICAHIGYIAGSGLQDSSSKCLVTGGGAYNNSLVLSIKTESKAHIHIPQKEIVSMKEAICFGFLGLMRILEQPNTYKSVTGAQRDSTGGAVYLP